MLNGVSDGTKLIALALSIPITYNDNLEFARIRSHIETRIGNYPCASMH